MQKEEKKILITVIIMAIAITTAAIIGELTLGAESDTIQGQAEVTEFRVSSKVPGRILRIYVKEGDTVQAGDTVAILEAPDITAKLTQAKAIEEAAVALNDKVRQGTRPQEKQTAYEMWQKSIAALNIAKITFERIDNLYNKGVTTAQKHDEALAAYNAAKATEQAAKAQYNLALAGAQIQDKEITEAKFRQAQGAVEEVNSYLNETILTAIKDGEVSNIFLCEGELAGAGAPIMNIAYLDDIWVSLNIREDYLKNFNVGNIINGYIPALGKRIKMSVYYIKDLGTYAVWRATKSNGEYDIKTFEVRARPLEKIKELRPGMSILANKKQ